VSAVAAPRRVAGTGVLRAGYELTGLELDIAGSARAARRLREALQARPELDMVTLAQPSSPSVLSGRVARGLARELAWFPVQLPRRARALGLDILHCPMPLAPLHSPVPLVLTLMDAMAWERPEWFGRALVAQHRLVLSRAVRRATRVLVPSRHSAERICDVLGVDPARIDVTPYAPDPVFTPGRPDRRTLSRLGVEGSYVLTVGTLQPRKNLESALEVFERLTAEGARQRLVVVGARGWRDRRLADRLGSSPAQGRVEALGRVSDAELVELYRGADCLLYCSRGEGFGFPTLEAMACGTPVVCSSTTSLGEVAGDAAVLADPEDVDDIQRALGEVLGSAARRAELSRRGRERAAMFSWDRCAELTLTAYRRAAGS
jgi:glycosyltransferase involved in cell wall biosynthesis